MHYRSVVHLQVTAAVATIAAALAWAFQAPADQLPAARAAVVAAQAKWFAIPLAVAVFLVMLKRGRNAELIRGVGAGPETPGLHGAMLRNTVEQTLLAVLSLAAFVVVAPKDLGTLVQVFTALFCVGRLFFFVGYAFNPMWRFYGFSINFYSSACYLALAWWFSSRSA